MILENDRLGRALLRIDLYSGVGINRIDHHKYDFDMMYFLLLQKQKNITNEADCIYYAQSTDPVRWVGGFCEDDEFSVDFDNIPAYVDTIVLLAMTQKCRNTPQPTLRDVEFEITLMDLAGKQIARHTTIVAGPRLFCDIFRILRDDDGWRITSPGIQLYKTIEDRLQVKP